MKKLTLLLIAAIMVFSLFGCENEKNISGTSNSQSDTIPDDTSVSVPDADTAVPDAEASVPDEENETIIAKREKILSLSADSEGAQLTFREREDGHEKGYNYAFYEPTAFTVLENGNIAIVDSVARCIKVFDTQANVIETVKYSIERENDMPILLTEKDGVFCIVVKPYGPFDDEGMNYCYALLIESDKADKVEMATDYTAYTTTPRFAEFTESGTVKVTAQNHKVIEIDFETDNFTENGVENTKLDTVMLSNPTMTNKYIGADESGNAYFYHLIDIDNETKTIRMAAYDKTGKMILSSKFSKPENTSYTDTCYTVSGGHVYYFVCTEGSVEFYKVTLGNADVSLSSYKADDARLNRFASLLEDMLKFVDTERFAESERLNIISGVSKEHTFDEAMALLDDFRNTTQSYGWYKKSPLTTEGEENGKGNKSYFENGGIICYDDGFATSEAGIEDNAQSHMLDCNNNCLTFSWEYRYLSPAISTLCKNGLDDLSDKESFKTVTEGFFKTYLPKYYPKNAEITIEIDSDAKSATAIVRNPPIPLDPDNEDLAYNHIASTLEFRWDDFELALSKSDEKALLHRLTLYYPLNEEFDVVTKPVITAESAWGNVISGDFYEMSCSKDDISFGVGDVFVHDYYIGYRIYDDEYQPCYIFICSENDGDSLFTVTTRAS